VTTPPTKRLECRDLTVIIAVLLVLAVAGLGYGISRAIASPRVTSPPQCFTVRIAEPGAARNLWVRFCGTGPGGTSPLEEGVSGHGPLVVDGSDLTPGDCPHAAPCVVLWPASPQH